MGDAVLTASSFILLLIVCGGGGVPVGATGEGALEPRFHALFVDMSFIAMSGSEVEENKSTIAVLGPGGIINDEVLAVHIEAVVIEDNLTAAVQAAGIEVFVIEAVIREEVRAVDVEALSMRDEIEVEVWAVTEEAEQMNVIWTVSADRDEEERCR